MRMVENSRRDVIERCLQYVYSAELKKKIRRIGELLLHSIGVGGGGMSDISTYYCIIIYIIIYNNTHMPESVQLALLSLSLSVYS